MDEVYVDGKLWFLFAVYLLPTHSIAYQWAKRHERDWPPHAIPMCTN